MKLISRSGFGIESHKLMGSKNDRGARVGFEQALEMVSLSATTGDI